MSYSTKISNSTSRTIATKYRMPGNPASIITITIQPRALLNEIFFIDESYYKEWKRQNQDFFDRKVLYENEKNTKVLENSGKEADSQTSERMKARSNKAVENVEEAADNVNASIKVETEDLRERKRTRRNSQ